MNDALICIKTPGNIQMVISRVVWHVDEERPIRIRYGRCDTLPSWGLRHDAFESRFAPFRRTLSVYFIHQTT